VSDDLADKTGAETAKPKRKRGPGKPFQAGAPSANPNGRPRGSRNKATLLAEALIDGQAEALVRKGLELALGGDISMLRTMLGFILPAKRDRHLTLTLPPIETASDALLVSRAIVEGVASGELSPEEGASMSKTLETHIKLFEVVDLETRLTELERERGLAPGMAVQ
jgi:hypothetical protein